MKLRSVLTAMAAMAVASSAFAWPGEEPPPPPPPKEYNDCSPGFWKNHTELWFGYACAIGSECDGWLDELKAKGPGSGFIRHGRADYLNAWADGNYGFKVCKD